MVDVVNVKYIVPPEGTDIFNLKRGAVCRGIWKPQYIPVVRNPLLPPLRKTSY